MVALENTSMYLQLLPQVNNDRPSSQCVQLDGYVERIAYSLNQYSVVLSSLAKLENHSSTKMSIIRKWRILCYSVWNSLT